MTKVMKLTIWVELNCGKTKNIVCGCVYRHPNSMNLLKYHISKCLAKISKEEKKCYIAGDFNVDPLKYGNNNKRHKKGPTNNVNNYQPISLLSTFSKILKKLVAIR